MNSNDLISVIIPVYNVEKYLNRCIESVINQTYKNLEVILIDDGSTDNSGKICDEYAKKDNRIKVIHKQNGGVSSARNAGLSIAKGEYIGFVDSDDYIEKDMYEFLYNLLLEHKVQVSCCNRFVLEKNKFVQSLDFPKDVILSFNEILNDRGYAFYIWNKLVSKKTIENIRFSEKLILGEDLLFCLDVFKKAENVVFSKEAKYYYFNNDGSVTRKKIFKKEYLEHILFHDKLIKYCEDNKLKIGYKKYLNRQIEWIVYLLFLIIKGNDLTDKNSISFLLKYARKNLWRCMFGKFKFFKKCFILLCCVNFNLAGKICRFINR